MVWRKRRVIVAHPVRRREHRAGDPSVRIVEDRETSADDLFGAREGGSDGLGVIRHGRHRVCDEAQALERWKGGSSFASPTR
jgi:hypothetical protein